MNPEEEMLFSSDHVAPKKKENKIKSYIVSLVTEVASAIIIIAVSAVFCIPILGWIGAGTVSTLSLAYVVVQRCKKAAVMFVLKLLKLRQK